MATVPPEFDQFVATQVATGRYESTDDVVAAGLQLLMERERRLDELRAEILPAIEELDRGGGIVVPANELRDYFDRLMSRVNKQLRAEKIDG